jgi:hypothetical protein
VQRERIDNDLASLALLRARMDDLAAHRARTEAPPAPANPLGAGSDPAAAPSMSAVQRQRVPS